MKRVAVCLWAILLLLPCLAFAVSFDIVENSMEISIQPDGAGLFEENLVYAFDDSYNGILITLRHQDVQLTGLRVFVDDGIELERVDALDGVPYTYTAETQGDETSLQVFAPGSGGTRAFRLSYRMGGFALRYLDSARINQILFRSANALENATVCLILPKSDPDAVLAFAHGAASNEDIAVDGAVLTLGPLSIPSGGYLEMDVLFPAEWLPKARMIQADTRGEALALEESLQAAAAEEAAEAARLAGVLRATSMAALLAYAAVFAFLFLRLRSKYGMRRPPLSTMDSALLDALPPAVAQLLRDKSVTASGFSATLLSLSERGVLTLTTAEDDTGFILSERPGGLASHEAYLLDWLFGNPDQEILWTGSLDAKEDYEAAQAFTVHYNAWKAQVTRDAKAAGLLFQNGGIRAVLGVLSCAIGLSLAMVLLAQEVISLGILSAALAILFAVLFSGLRRLTDAGEKAVGAINGFLESYRDRLETAPHSVLGRVPLSMALGYLKPLSEWMDRQPEAPMQYGDAGFSPVYTGALMRQLMHMEHSVNESQSHNARVQDPRASDDSGSSGGLGGSSGGAGGGNSYGAW